MTTLKEDIGFATMATQTELDLAAQMHYEESLAACYEAEYMLSLRMDEELHSGGGGQYDYEDDSEVVTGGQGTEGQSWSVAGGLTADRYDQTEDCVMDCSSGHLGVHLVESETPGDALNSMQHSYIESRNGELPFSHHSSKMSPLLPSDVGAVTNGEAFSFRNECLGLSYAGSQHHWSFSEDVGGCHLEGPCRKKCRLQRPEC